MELTGTEITFLMKDIIDLENIKSPLILRKSYQQVHIRLLN